jgi:hypothetical protein
MDGTGLPAGFFESLVPPKGGFFLPFQGFVDIVDIGVDIFVDN